MQRMSREMKCPGHDEKQPHRMGTPAARLRGDTTAKGMFSLDRGPLSGSDAQVTGWTRCRGAGNVPRHLPPS